MADDGGPTRVSEAPSHDDTLPADDLVGDELANKRRHRYRLGVELGRGGMGRVVEAYDTQLGRTVALKEVLPKGGTGIQRRFLREVQITARLEHASIVPLYDSGTTQDGRPFYVMRRVTGRPLDDMFKRMRSLDERLTLVPAMLAAIDAIAHAHDRGVIHRDLKPANILIGDNGETVVIDWGLAKVIGEEDDRFEAMPSDALQTQAGSVFGTPGFMAPEQARGEVLGPHGDVYALGATFYQLLAGKPPHAGNSASEVLDHTVNNDPVQPLAEVCPGAPPELIAIVDKALSFDAAMRYPNAAALADDVRRFQAGQLVAAHRYTPRERVLRFVRRHRATLVVAASALVTLGVLGWISVHKIIVERDAADQARHVAVVGQRAAEEARDRLIRQTDSLIVTEAAAIVSKNPTEAVAVLKGLSAHSHKQSEARAVAEEAVLRGVAWSMQTSDSTPLQVEISPDTSRVAVFSLDDVMLRVFDLDARRLLLARPYTRTTRVAWIDDGKRLLVTRQGTPPEIVDPGTGEIKPVPLPAMDRPLADLAGSRVMFSDDRGRAGMLDVATLTARILSDGTSKVTNYEIASDGSWYVISTRAATTAYDASGKELATYKGDVSVIATSRFRDLAILVDKKVLTIRVDAPSPAWLEVPLALAGEERPLTLMYRGRELEVFRSTAVITGWIDKSGERPARSSAAGGAKSIDGKTKQVATLEGLMTRGTEAGDGLALVAASDGSIAYFDDVSSGRLTLPSAAPHVRVAARPGKSRVVAAGNGILFVYELDAIVPKVLDIDLNAPVTYLDDTTLLVYPFGDLGIYDLPTHQLKRFSVPNSGMTMIAQLAEDGRLMIKDMFSADQHHDESRLLELHKNHLTPRALIAGRDVFGSFIDGNGIVVTPGDNRVQGRTGDEPLHDIVALDARVQGLAPAGRGRFAALSDSGELVRGPIDGGTLEHAKVDAPPGSSIGGMDACVVIAAGNRLLRWDTTVHELARVEKPIVQVHPMAAGVLVMLADNEALFFDTTTNQMHRLAGPSRTPPIINQEGTTFASFGPNDEVIVVEIPSLARFSLPRVFMPGRDLTVAPDGRHFIQKTSGHSAPWSLPPVRTDLSVWLDELTNASEDADGMMVWPWQTKP